MSHLSSQDIYVKLNVPTDRWRVSVLVESRQVGAFL